MNCKLIIKFLVKKNISTLKENLKWPKIISASYQKNLERIIGEIYDLIYIPVIWPPDYTVQHFLKMILKEP